MGWPPGTRILWGPILPWTRERERDGVQRKRRWRRRRRTIFWKER